MPITVIFIYTIKKLKKKQTVIILILMLVTLYIYILSIYHNNLSKQKIILLSSADLKLGERIAVIDANILLKTDCSRSTADLSPHKFTLLHR